MQSPCQGPFSCQKEGTFMASTEVINIVCATHVTDYCVGLQCQPGSARLLHHHQVRQPVGCQQAGTYV